MCPTRHQNTAPPATPSDDEAHATVLPGTRSPLDPSRALKVGGHGLPREHVRQVQRDRLIDGFVQVVVEEGYDRAGIKAICRRAGVAFNTFYEYFETKEELFLIAYDAGVTILFDRVAQGVPGRRRPVERAGRGGHQRVLARSWWTTSPLPDSSPSKQSRWDRTS